MTRKESRQFNMSVEGINCERMYFEHLEKLINSSNRNTYSGKAEDNFWIKPRWHRHPDYCPWIMEGFQTAMLSRYARRILRLRSWRLQRWRESGSEN